MPPSSFFVETFMSPTNIQYVRYIQFSFVHASKSLKGVFRTQLNVYYGALS